MGRFMKHWLLYTVVIFAPLASVAQYGYANMNLQGSGYWGGQQNCGYQQTQNTGRTQAQGKSQAPEKSEEEKAASSRIADLKKQLASKQLEKKRAESEMQMAARKLERVFDSEILDFLLEVHIEKGNECKNYRTFPANNCVIQTATGQTAVAEGTVDANGAQVITGAVAKVDCEGKDEVPDKLKSKWTTTGSGSYCTATSRSSGGSISASICKDQSLRSEERKSSSSASDCGQQLGNYRKNRIKRDDVQAKIERIEDDIENQTMAIADAKERLALEKSYRMSNTTEAACEECGDMDRDGGQRQKSNRDWGSILGNIGVGLGLAYVGKQYDESNAEYSAQLGYPPQSGYPTAVSMGAPYILNGVYGAVNGSSGQGSFGCSNGASQMNAFGYPQSMLGQQTSGGGMYSMGYNPYNSMYGNTNNNIYGYGTGTMNSNTLGGNNYQSQLLALQYQQQMAQYQSQYYQQQYQQQMQAYQQQQQTTQQSQQIQQEIYNLQLRLQNINTGTYNYGTTNSGLTYSGGYYGTYGTTNTGTSTPPTWIPGSTNTIYTVPTTYSTTTNGR